MHLNDQSECIIQPQEQSTCRQLFKTQLTTKISKLQNIMKTVNLHEKQVLGKSSVCTEK